MARTLKRPWRFYGRANERSQIARILSSANFFFCAISGRRRIGKTSLIREAISELGNAVRTLYVQIPDSDVHGVVQIFRDALEDSGVLDTTLRSRRPERIKSIEEIRNLRDMARAIAFLCRVGVVVVLDEFQYFHRAALAEFTSHLQAEVDLLRNTKRGGIFILGSIHTEMTAIIEDRDSPLFNRVTHRLPLRHWDFGTLFEMFEAHRITDPHQQLFLWTLFEGVPKFYKDAHEAGVLSPRATRGDTLRELFFEGTSPLKDEAANWFLRELRGRYDSVLRLLSRIQPCSYGQLVAEYSQNGTGDAKQLSIYLKTLMEKYQMVEALQPIFATTRDRKSRYVISDNFLSSWLAALSRSVDLARIQPVDRALERADTALQTHEGKALEKMVRPLIEELSRSGKGDLALSHVVAGYWNKAAAGSDIEIDLVAADDGEAVVRFGCCKRSPSRFSPTELRKFRDHVARFLTTSEGARFGGYEHQYALYTTQFDPNVRRQLEHDGYFCASIKDLAAILRG
jgi:AAA+ ATPase superfamily predicted ATPase